MKDLEKIPWFAILGVLLFLNMFVMHSSDVASLFPAYMSAMLFFIGLGYGFMSEHKSQGFAVFLMGLIWLLQNVMLWSNSEAGVWLWLTFLVQLLLTYYFFTGKTLKFAGEAGLPWTYAALWIVFITGLAKLLTGLSAGALAQIPLWSIGVLLVAFGYVIKPAEDDWAAPLQLIGTILCLVSAFTMAVPLA